VQPTPEADIHLSIVATSRNDNHGGYLTHRMQHFVNGLVAQCKRHGLRAELVLVEWNPPADRRPLAEELAWPEDCGPCDIRIITVPREVHARIPHGDKLPLFQMIAKNVGIRRARGQFVLATNIDILFSNEAIRFLRDRLKDGCLYRTDRVDVPTELPAVRDFEEVLRFCRDNSFRVHAPGFTLVKRDGHWHPRSPLWGSFLVVWASFVVLWNAGVAILKRPMAADFWMSLGSDADRKATFDLRRMAKIVSRKARSLMRFMRWAHQTVIKRELFTNACGDFTLLSAKDWARLTAYPEWPMYSWHLDSILLYQANRSGIREVYLGKSAPVYHIEHEPGSGFTPESSDKLFDRLAARGIPYLDWHKDVEPMVAKMDEQRARGAPIRYNDADWGYANLRFAETRVHQKPTPPDATECVVAESYRFG